MQTTNKTFEEPVIQPQERSHFEDLTIFKCDPDEFKKFLQEEELQEDVLAQKEQPLQIIPSLMHLATTKSPLLAVDATLKTLAPINLEKTLDVLLENMVLLISHICLAGIDQTSITIQDQGSLIDNTEIIIERYDTAPGEFNIEIKACSKLQGLLINQKEILLERMALSMPEIKIKRLELSHHGSQDYIGSSKQKKVVRGEKTKK